MLNRQNKKNTPLKEKEHSRMHITESEDHPRETIHGMPGMITQPYTSSYALLPSQSDNSLTGFNIFNSADGCLEPGAG